MKVLGLQGRAPRNVVGREMRHPEYTVLGHNLERCVQVWDPQYKTDVNTLERIKGHRNDEGTGVSLL